MLAIVALLIFLLFVYFIPWIDIYKDNKGRIHCILWYYWKDKRKFKQIYVGD